MKLVKPIFRSSKSFARQSLRAYASAPATATRPAVSPFAPRHFLSIADLSLAELTALVRNASSHKSAVKSGQTPNALTTSLLGQTVAMTFNKLSTRTRVSTESAVARMGGHPMFLGKNDIQLGTNESLYDHAVVISSMASAIVARVHKHSEVAELAKYSSVPVINALSDLSHPLQILADYLTISESFPSASGTPGSGLGLEGMNIAWVGDGNNVCADLAIGAQMLGINMTVCTPQGYGLTSTMQAMIADAAKTVSRPGSLTENADPLAAVKDADIIVSDTWVNMGQEVETKERMKAFTGFQVTNEMAEKGGARKDWKFMHCLPRHSYEVSDEVFYGPRSLVFPEAENRVWTAMGKHTSPTPSALTRLLTLTPAALEGFVVNKGKIN